jgi:hypothetical protein
MKTGMKLKLRARRRQANGLGGNKFEGIGNEQPTKEQKAEALAFKVSEQAKARSQNRGLTLRRLT